MFPPCRAPKGLLAVDLCVCGPLPHGEAPPSQPHTQRLNCFSFPPIGGVPGYRGRSLQKWSEPPLQKLTPSKINQKVFSFPPIGGLEKWRRCPRKPSTKARGSTPQTTNPNHKLRLEAPPTLKKNKHHSGSVSWACA